VINPNSRKQPIAKTLGKPQSSPSHLGVMPGTVPSQDMIRARAYELYESRGGEAGHDEQDWLRAEQEILKADGQ
jgi:Protein of unknown function (DUF2934)